MLFVRNFVELYVNELVGFISEEGGMDSDEEIDNGDSADVVVSNILETCSKHPRFCSAPLLYLGTVRWRG